MYIGIDIGGTKCAVTRAQTPRTVEKKIRFDTATVSETLNRIFEAVAACMPADAIGVSCGGECLVYPSVRRSANTDEYVRFT